MHRDVKVGLSLGILLVGIVGALFLRREPEKKEDNVPQLQNSQKLDEAIAGREHVPHLTGIAEDTGNDPAPPPAKNAKGEVKAVAKGPYHVPEFLSAEEAKTQQDVLSGRSVSAPDPIQPPQPKTSKKDLVATPAAPAHNSDWESPGSQKSKSSKGAEMVSKDNGKPNSGGQKHVIQPGDTLSGIAARYLGSSGRFKEIYDANRNVLRTPNDLPEGATLVIPDTKPGTKTNATPVKETTESTSAVEETAPSGPISFQPVNRSPFNAGRAPRTGTAPPRNSQMKEKIPTIEVEN